MSTHYFKCSTCDSTFLTGEGVCPDNLICVFGRCNISEISLEEANKIVEDGRDGK